MTSTLPPELIAQGKGDARQVPYDHDDGLRSGMRAWLREMDGIGELRVVEGVDAEASIGLVSEMLHHTEESPAVLFDAIPGYPKGWRVLVNSLGNRRRLGHDAAAADRHQHLRPRRHLAARPRGRRAAADQGRRVRSDHRERHEGR